MEDNTLVGSTVSATIHAPVENLDIPTRCFALPEWEYQACSPSVSVAEIRGRARGARRVRPGKRGRR